MRRIDVLFSSRQVSAPIARAFQCTIRRSAQGLRSQNLMADPFDFLKTFEGRDVTEITAIVLVQK